jgi:hypothetical protein
VYTPVQQSAMQSAVLKNDFISDSSERNFAFESPEQSPIVAKTAEITRVARNAYTNKYLHLFGTGDSRYES